MIGFVPGVAEKSGSCELVGAAADGADPDDAELDGAEPDEAFDGLEL